MPEQIWTDVGTLASTCSRQTYNIAGFAYGPGSPSTYPRLCLPSKKLTAADLTSRLCPDEGIGAKPNIIETISETANPFTPN